MEHNSTSVSGKVCFYKGYDFFRRTTAMDSQDSFRCS